MTVIDLGEVRKERHFRSIKSELGKYGFGSGEVDEMAGGTRGLDEDDPRLAALIHDYLAR